jgi:hypothetical protein
MAVDKKGIRVVKEAIASSLGNDREKVKFVIVRAMARRIGYGY